jgi:hypothetical protein
MPFSLSASSQFASHRFSVVTSASAAAKSWASAGPFHALTRSIAVPSMARISSR